MNYKPALVLALAATVIAANGAAARRHKDKIPDPKLDSGNVFAPPDGGTGLPATYVTGAGVPLANTRAPRLPDFQMIRQLPSLTPEQRRQLDSLERELNIRTGAMRDSIASLQQRLDAARAHPNETVTMQNTAVPPADVLKARIKDLQAQIQEQRNQSLSLLFGVLTDTQRKQYLDMRHGALVIPAESKSDGDK